MKRIGWPVVHPDKFDSDIREPSLLQLPFQMLLAVFDYMTQGAICGKLEVVENFLSESHVDHVPNPVKVRCGAEQNASRFHHLFNPVEDDVASHRQMLDDFEEKNEVEPRQFRNR